MIMFLAIGFLVALTIPQTSMVAASKHDEDKVFEADTKESPVDAIEDIEDANSEK